jgi:hypothetical protein
VDLVSKRIDRSGFNVRLASESFSEVGAPPFHLPPISKKYILDASTSHIVIQTQPTHHRQISAARHSPAVLIATRHRNILLLVSAIIVLPAPLSAFV